MQFISMDLIGEFHPPSWTRSQVYALTVICMHTSYVFCIPLKTKTAEEVQVYMWHVYSKFGGSEKILSDNSTEFKNKLFEEVEKKTTRCEIQGIHSTLQAPVQW